MNEKKVCMGVTGASGAVYSMRLIEVLLATGHDVHLSISPSGAQVIEEELDLTVDLENFHAKDLMLDNIAKHRTVKFVCCKSVQASARPTATCFRSTRDAPANWSTIITAISAPQWRAAHFSPRA